MEENNKTAENNKPSYEQLEKIAFTLQQNVLQLEAKLNSMHFLSMKLEFLFKVLDKHTHFDEGFLKECKNQIETILVGTEDEQDK